MMKTSYKLNLLMIVFILLNIKVAFGANFTGYPGTFIELDVKNINVLGLSSDGISADLCRVSNVGFDSEHVYYSSWSATITSIDGWTGALGSDGLLYVLYSGSTKHNANSGSSGTINYTTTYSAKGIASTDMGAVKRNDVCFDVDAAAANRQPSSGANLSGTIRTGIYIPPNTPLGTYTLKKLYIGFYGMVYQQGSEPAISDNDTITVTEPPSLECTISAPPTINFGMVNIIGASADKLLSSKTQGINITCSSDYADTVAKEMNISFTKTSGGGGWWRLNVSNTAGDVMAYIRARYVNEGGTCTGDSANELGFDGVNGKKTINNVGVGITNIPITWSLCSNGSGLLGVGTAQATVNINWD